MLDLFRRELLSALGTDTLRLADQADIPLALSTGRPEPQSVVLWRIDRRGGCSFHISQKITVPERAGFFARRLAGIWPLLDAYHRRGVSASGEVRLSLGDFRVRPGLAFAAPDESLLIPDPVFLGLKGYAATRAHFEREGIGWAQKQPVAIWRGSTTGPKTEDWQTLPRIRLCELSLESPDFLDAGITNIVQLPAAVALDIESAGYMRNTISTVDFASWRFQIDIDGNSNSWPGLFQKLLTGCTVLKIASPKHWRQWYYDRLEPWVNFVPVDSDMSDLVEKISWLRSHDGRAVEIGRAGQALAYSLTYESELRAAMPTIDLAFSQAGQ